MHSNKGFGDDTNNMLNACRQRQYAKAELLVGGALKNAQKNHLLEPNLVSAIYSLASHYIFAGRQEKARELFEQLIWLKRKLHCLDCAQDWQFEMIAASQLNKKMSIKEKIMQNIGILKNTLAHA